MHDKSHVLIIGAGAVGSFYGAILKRAGCTVSVVLRSEYDIVAANGIVLESPMGDLSFQPDHVYRDGDTNSAPDYVLLCVKVLPSIDRAALLRPWVGPHTRIALIENGIDIEPELVAAYPGNPLISCSAFIAVSRVAPGQVRHSAHGRLIMGSYPRGIDGDCRDLASLFEAGGIEARLTESIVTERWKKCIWNTPLNPLSVLADGAESHAMLNAPGGEQLVREMMAEVCAVAAADGHPLPQQKLIDGNIEGTRNMPSFRNSMAQDYLSERPIELDAILGNVVAIARRHDVPVPRLETVYTALRMRGF